MREYLSIFLKGFFMGSADTVPGVSGGTVAVITGIYERLIDALTGLDPRALEHLVRPHDPAARAAVRDHVRALDLPFLFPLGAGILTAVVILSRFLHAAVVDHPGPTFGFFFGLIAASAVVLYGEVDVGTPRRMAVAVTGIVLAALLTGVTSNGVPHYLPVVFVAGAVAITAMVLPGISGAFLLLVFGQYEFMTGTLSQFVDGVVALVDGGRVAALVAPGVVVVTFCAGAGIGLMTVAHAVDWALERYRAATLTFLVSLMVGSLRLPVERVLDASGTGEPLTLAVALGAAIVGGLLVVGIDRYTDDLDYTDAETGDAGEDAPPV